MSAAPPCQVSALSLERFRQRLTQHDLALRAGVSRETISRLERGETPQLRTARAIARALRGDLDRIFPATSEARAGNPGLAKSAVMGDGHAPD